jgi:methylmalonyl-CoA mutase cobalamin-binding subunit
MIVVDLVFFRWSIKISSSELSERTAKLKKNKTKKMKTLLKKVLTDKKARKAHVMRSTLYKSVDLMAPWLG